eukprot:537849-Pyramimonas_sp.AAC.1
MECERIAPTGAPWQDSARAGAWRENATRPSAHSRAFATRSKSAGAAPRNQLHTSAGCTARPGKACSSA